jgi:NADH dehydrogenase
VPARILILGGGFGGLTAARRLERLLPQHAARVTLISDVNFMLYTPLLPGAAGGTLEPRHVVVSLRDELSTTELRLAHVVGADPERKVVRVRGFEGDEDDVPYDHLLVGLGSTSRAFPIPGLAEHALGFKTIAEAIAIRNRMLQCMERAEACTDPAKMDQLLGFVFVGAGYAGLEGIAELQDFADDVLDHYPRCKVHGMRFVLVEARGRVMPEISASLAEFAVRELEKRGIEIRTNTTLEEVTATTARLSDGTVIPTRTLCWTAGVKPVREVAELGLPLDDAGRIRVDACLKVPEVRDVWAHGDAAAVPDPARPGQPCPPTCQHALRQGRLAAANIARSLKGRDPEPFTYKTLGVFVDMGRFKAVAETSGIRWRGFPAWFLARTYHLAMMPGFRRKLRLMADWTVALMFGRDATELGQLGHPPRLEVPAALEAEPFDARPEVAVGGAGAALDDRPRA